MTDLIKQILEKNGIQPNEILSDAIIEICEAQRNNPADMLEKLVHEIKDEQVKAVWECTIDTLRLVKNIAGDATKDDMQELMKLINSQKH